MTAETLFDPLFLSRLQFALKALFHILWSSLSIGLILYIFLMEALWLRRKDNFYYIQARFWTRFFLLIFAIGVVSGIPMGFEFGTNWGRFAAAKNGFIGEMLGVEATMAFMLEAGFLGIMAFGWGRVSKGLHLFATAMVALGTSLSAFWIMVANSWMQTPSGLSPAGSSVVTSYLQAIFNPDMPWGVSHMYVAALETTLFFVGAVSASVSPPEAPHRFLSPLLQDRPGGCRFHCAPPGPCRRHVGKGRGAAPARQTGCFRGPLGDQPARNGRRLESRRLAGPGEAGEQLGD